MTETSPGEIRLTKHEGIAQLILDNPTRRNAINLAMWRALPRLVNEAAADPGMRLLIVRGGGDGPFTAGADVSEFASTRADAAGNRAYESENVAAFAALAACPFPTLAIIRGACMGAGLGLAAACDLRIAAEDAAFAIPAGRLGVGYPPAAIPSLVAALGPDVVKALFLTAGRLDATRAHRIGFLWQVSPVTRLDEDARRLADDVATNAPLTLRAAKRAIASAAGLIDVAPALLQADADACFASADFQEGLQAFEQSRRPHFNGY